MTKISSFKIGISNVGFMWFLALTICHFIPQVASAQDSTATPDAMNFSKQLYDRLRCGSCHEVAAQGINAPPPLDYAGSQFQREWLVAYLQAPHRRRWQDDGVRPIARMPDFLLSENEAKVLATYLASLVDTSRFKPLPPEFLASNPDKVLDAREIYKEYACSGCHTIAGDGGKVGPDLTHAGSRLRPEYLAVFLKNPRALIPDSPMKNFDLWDDEIEALVAYLMSLK